MNGNIVLKGIKYNEQIPSDAIEFNGHYYKMSDESLSRSNAKSKCEVSGGHLVTINTAEEQKFLIDLVKTSNKKNMWIGAYPDNGIFKWVTDEMFSYTNWASGEPNNVFNMQNAAMMYTQNAAYPSGTWNDENGEGRNWSGYYLSDFGYICEWEPETLPELESPNLTIEQYMSNVILGYNYSGCLNTLNGSTPQNYLYEYALQAKQISLLRIYVDLLHENSKFMNNVTTWESLTFSPSDVYESVLDEVGYCEAILANILDTAVKYTLIPTAVKETSKTTIDLTSTAFKILKQNSDLKYEELLNQNWAMFDEAKQFQPIEAVGEECASLKKCNRFFVRFIRYFFNSFRYSRGLRKTCMS